MEGSLNLVLLFMSFKNHSYVKAMVLQFIHFSFWSDTGHPVWSLLQRFPQSFVEEDGEISLSLLCHAATCHGIQYDRSYLVKMYKLIHTYRQAFADSVLDLEIRVAPTKHHNVNPGDPQVQTISTSMAL